ncbi:hypothetical protein AD954_01105 [Acetobacter cerevisiae]|uniref:Uncharacterized protein n=1 Tax=Acetobacter cerevisiae TaxID=178900 RepID=A0A149VFP8_9PROT|nr:hypothetical protein AD954_01105 [Acetobacter cerevisiae]
MLFELPAFFACVRVAAPYRPENTLFFPFYAVLFFCFCTYPQILRMAAGVSLWISSTGCVDNPQSIFTLQDCLKNNASQIPFTLENGHAFLDED